MDHGVRRKPARAAAVRPGPDRHDDHHHPDRVHEQYSDGGCVPPGCVIARGSLGHEPARAPRGGWTGGQQRLHASGWDAAKCHRIFDRQTDGGRDGPRRSPGRHRVHRDSHTGCVLPRAAGPRMTAAGEGKALARRLGAFDATMIVMGGIVGAGIFLNPSVVARQVGTPPLILAAWAAGGAIALAGAFVYAELAQRRPEVGGQYAYLRDAFHPMAAFLYGWTLLLVTQTGGMAAVAMTFANYFRELTGWNANPSLIAVAALATLTVINCLGVRSGTNVQNALMVKKIAAILMLVILGWRAAEEFGVWAGTREAGEGSGRTQTPDLTPQTNFLAAMVPVLFAYGGWQTASFVSGEMRNPERDLPRGLLFGVLGVVVLYLAVNLVCILALGPSALAGTQTPASEVMRRAFGEGGARLIAAGIAVSTIGFLSQGMLTAPRVYYAMARDGVFFKRVGTLDPRSRAPVVAILLQG